MTTRNQIVDEILLSLESYGLTQPRITSLSATINSSATTFAVTSATNVSVGLIEVDDELMYVQNVDQSTNTLTVLRGYRTTAAGHDAGAIVTVMPLWPKQQIITVVNDAIQSAYPTLFKVATAELTASGVDNTYSLSGAGKVLAVRNLSIGPLTEWLKVNRYRYDADLGKLTIYDGLIVGSSLHVLYTAPPTAFTAGTDQLTTTGLQESAKAYVVLMATAKLVMHMDGSRLAVNSASADDMEPNRSVGSATKIAQTLLAAAEMELNKEQKRLREKYPVTISISKGGMR